MKPTLRVTDIAFIGIVTENPAMRMFYREVLGLEVLAEDPDRFTYFATDERGRLELLAPHTNTATRQFPNRVSFGLLVENLNDAVATLDAHNVAHSEIFGWEKRGVTQRWLFLRDPDGNGLLVLEQSGDELAMRRV